MKDGTQRTLRAVMSTVLIVSVAACDREQPRPSASEPATVATPDNGAPAPVDRESIELPHPACGHATQSPARPFELTTEPQDPPRETHLATAWVVDAKDSQVTLDVGGILFKRVKLGMSDAPDLKYGQLVDVEWSQIMRRRGHYANGRSFFDSDQIVHRVAPATKPPPLRNLVYYRPKLGGVLRITDDGVAHYGDMTFEIPERQLQAIFEAFQGVTAPASKWDLVLNCVQFQPLAVDDEQTASARQLLEQLLAKMLKRYDYRITYRLRDLEEWPVEGTSLADLEPDTWNRGVDGADVAIPKKLARQLHRDPPGSDAPHIQQTWSQDGVVYRVWSMGEPERFGALRAETCADDDYCKPLPSSISPDALPPTELDIAVEQMLEIGTAPWREDALVGRLIASDKILDRVRLHRIPRPAAVGDEPGK